MPVFNLQLKKIVDDSYDIEIGYDLSDKLVSDILGGLLPKANRFAVITDSNVLPLYARPITDKLRAAGLPAEIFSFPAGEKSKSREVKAMLEDEMLSRGFRRDCAVIAVGGGVVTDLAGFLAGTFGRGVPFVNYATTLLSAADASVGGKTAVDTPLATNLIGLFNQPRKVYIDIQTWETLPVRELRSGLAETVKHACLADAAFFAYLEENIDAVLRLEKTACEHIALKNCEIKYKVVMQDERESGLREVLNLGHTVGRAVETVSDYRLTHGEAVAVGLVAAARLAQELGYMTKAETERLEALLVRCNLPVRIPEYVSREELVRKLYTDKKVRNGKLRFVLQDGIGAVKQFGENVYALPVAEAQIASVIAKM